jgi:hypothetical protein
MGHPGCWGWGVAVSPLPLRLPPVAQGAVEMTDLWPIVGVLGHFRKCPTCDVLISTGNMMSSSSVVGSLRPPPRKDNGGTTARKLDRSLTVVFGD